MSLIGEEEVVVVLVGVALLARIDLNPPVGVDSMLLVLFTGDVADLTGLATLGDTNCMADLVGLGDRRRWRWSIFTCVAQFVKTYL